MSNKAKIREEAKKLNPIDDLMFRTMAEDKAFCEEILRVILSDPALTVLESTPQYAGTNPQGRSVILDAKCVLGDGRIPITSAVSATMARSLQLTSPIPARSLRTFPMSALYSSPVLTSLREIILYIMWIGS